MEDLFDKLASYGRYAISFTLGIFFFLFDRLKPLLRRPLTAIALIGLLASSFVFLTLTLRAMLGLSAV